MLTFDYTRNNVKFAANRKLHGNIGFLLRQVCSPVEILAGNDSDSVSTEKVSVDFWEFKLFLVFGDTNDGKTVLGLYSNII